MPSLKNVLIIITILCVCEAETEGGGRISRSRDQVRIIRLYVASIFTYRAVSLVQIPVFPKYVNQLKIVYKQNHIANSHLESLVQLPIPVTAVCYTIGPPFPMVQHGEIFLNIIKGS